MKYLLIVPLLFMFGCTAAQVNYSLDAGDIAVETAFLKTKYEEAAILMREVQKKNPIFSEEEWATLNNMDSTIQMVILKYDAMLHFKDSNISFSDIQFLYNLSREAYTSGRDVIFAHWDDLQPSTQLMLKSFDVQAVQTSERITDLLENPSNANINETLVLIAGIMGTAVKMLTLVAL